MSHVVLLGDSIFDNARYVPDRPPVIEQLRSSLPPGWLATLLAIDGHVASDVTGQLAGMPADATHLFISVGGNDALGDSSVLRDVACTVAEALVLLGDVQARFRDDYHAMLRAVLALRKPTTVCTIYDAVPGLEQVERIALGAFNDVILQTAFTARLPVIDLRLVCTEAADYSPLSPIEPSVVGGAKIAGVIAMVATRHDFSRQHSAVYR
jgi:hypothetical protein